MKIIDLINKMMNGEEMPKKVKCENLEYVWNEESHDYTNGTYLVESLFRPINYCDRDFKKHFNKEVEIVD